MGNVDALLIEKIKDIMRDNKNWDWKTINKALQDMDIEIAPRTIRKYRLHIIKSLGINVTSVKSLHDSRRRVSITSGSLAS